MKSVFTLAFVSLTLVLTGEVYSRTDLWKVDHKPGKAIREKADRWARHYTLYQIPAETMRQHLSEAPMQGETGRNDFVFYLPMPDGGSSRFLLAESPVMERGLAEAYPQIRTYAGTGIDDPTATLRCDVTPFGFHAMMLSAGGSVFVDPVSLDEPDFCVSYFKKDALPQDFVQECLVEEEHDHHGIGEGKLAIAGELRTYRLALACTGEYAAFYGGTVVGALAGMVTTMNRVNGVYERELGIHMNLIANDTVLIYTNASTDPYTNNNGGTMLTQNQNNITNLIGAANYDIGHVFSTGGGGIAGLGVVCNNNQKARGVTGMNTPIGDAFDIDYVAHEMGHQFGGNHTFNSLGGACNGNRVGSAAYEPGSGSTIMAYAGICGNQDLQLHSDDYFHTKSFDEIVYYTRNNTGNTCPVLTTDGNQVPVLTVPGNYNIPLSTPFRLTATATDPDGDALTYCWEEYDLGPSGNWNNPSGNAPIFRSFNPVDHGTRLFPKLSNILNNNVTIGEIMPGYTRTLNFRCIVRDNVLTGAGVTYNPATVKVTVVATPGPFAVLSPNTTGITWGWNSTQTVTWSVSNTDLAPINVTAVNVLLSTDGGQTFPTVLGSGVPNTGSFSFTVPQVSTTTARVMVEAAGNIFFDINDKPFAISQAASLSEQEQQTGARLLPNPARGKVHLTLDHSLSGPVDVRFTDLTGKTVKAFTCSTRQGETSFDIDLAGMTPGIYLVTLTDSHSTLVQKLILE